MFSKTRVAVLRGGPSSEYHISLKTGANVLGSLGEKYHPIDVFIDTAGVWHLNGRREDPHRILSKVDVVWNALHGEYGEDGAVQDLLEAHHIPFTGPKRFAAAVSQSKALAKSFVQRGGIKTPHFKLIRKEETPSIKTAADELYRTFPQPCVIKPSSKGSSIGVSVAQTPEEITLALTAVFSISEVALVEEYIQGKEAVCGVIDDFRGARHYALIPVEVQLSQGTRFLDFDTRYGGSAMHRCPGHFTPQEKKELEQLAILAHTLLGLRHYSRSEFIVHPRRGIFFLEADSVPDLFDSTSPYIQSLHAIGSTVPHFVEHVLTLAQSGK